MENILDEAFAREEIDGRKVRYVGFWVRSIAALFDFLVHVPIIVAQTYNNTQWKRIELLILLSLLAAAYKPLMEYYYSATLGKIAVGIKVVNLNFQPLDFTTALLRYAPWLLVAVTNLIVGVIIFNDPAFQNLTSTMEFGLFQAEKGYSLYAQIASIGIYISVFALLFDKRKQGLHDKLAGTYCIYKEP